jgi:hypothetical protein
MRMLTYTRIAQMFVYVICFPRLERNNCLGCTCIYMYIRTYNCKVFFGHVLRKKWTYTLRANRPERFTLYVLIERTRYSVRSRQRMQRALHSCDFTRIRVKLRERASPGDNTPSTGFTQNHAVLSTRVASDLMASPSYL